MIDAVIFDFDGTLVATESLHFSAINDVLRPCGLELSWEEYEADYIAFDDWDFFHHRYRVAGRVLDLQQFQCLVAEKALRFLERIRSDGVVQIPGAFDLLDLCRGEGVLVGLCTGSTRGDVDAVLARINRSVVFDVIVTADDVERGKPDPECYIRAMDRLREVEPGQMVNPARCIAVEDTAGGLKAASAAGCRTLGVTTTCPSEMLHGADRIVANFCSVAFADLGQLVSP